MTGFWEGRGAPAVVDWCEPNYVVTPYVAEFWNTLSSLPMVVMGLVGIGWWWRRRGGPAAVSGRIALCFAGLAVVGVGSVAFHGTLLRSAQALDELPMVLVGMVGAWIVRYRDRTDGFAAAVAMAVYAGIFTVAYFSSSSTFLIFLASYTAVVAYVTLKSAWLSWIQPAPRLMAVLLALAAGGFLGTLAFCWIPEHVLLGCDHPLQALQLHSWWHLGAGAGTYLWCVWAVVDRWRLRGVEAAWSGLVVAPR